MPITIEKRHPHTVNNYIKFCMHSHLPTTSYPEKGRVLQQVEAIPNEWSYFKFISLSLYFISSIQCSCGTMHI